MIRHTLVGLALATLNLLPLQAQDYIWVEGESPASQSMKRHPWWYEKVKQDLLSGGDFIANFGDTVGEASYHIDVETAGAYEFWVRANPLSAKLSYRVDDGEWQEIGMGKVRGRLNLAADDKPDMRYIAWAKVGSVTLAAGRRTVSFRMHSGNNHHGMLDCFIFSRVPFSPNGANKPGEKSGKAMPGYWAFEPDADRFDREALLDLRGLNERVAGEHGWVSQDDQGRFLDGAGKPIRFWAVNTGVQNRRDNDDLAAHAKHLAKRGVNMVRHHGFLLPKQNGSKITDTDMNEVDKIQRLVAAMKQEGIYTTVSPYWGTHNDAQPSWGIPGHPNGNMPALLFWDETLQGGYKAWLKDLLTTPNPHDAKRTPLGKDPALAIFQIQNEDSFLFWTTMRLKDNPQELARLESIYGAWLKRNGKTTPATLNLKFWEAGNASQHLKDTFQFMTETMYAFNTEIERYIREDLGCPVLINAGNWHTANEILLLDQERYSYTANEVIGLNKYVTGVHINPEEGHKAGYLVSKGDYFTDGSKLQQPRKLATNAKQVAGSTFIIPESTWVPPLSYQSEAPFLVSAYSSLTGVDIYYWFALGNTGWDPTIEKWQAANPTIMGGWPAAALLYRKGYLQESEPVVHEVRALSDLWDLRSPILAEDEGFDPNRMAGEVGKESNIKHGVDPLAFLVGKVEVSYQEQGGTSSVIDLGPYIDNQAKTVTSVTGELVLDHDAGLCTMDAPKAQGASGFLKQAGAIELGDLTIRSGNDYATVMVVALDDKPLASSASVLVQVTTRDRPYGWQQSPATFKSKDGKTSYQGFRIDDTGSSPWNVQLADVQIELGNRSLKTATVLDANGYPKQEQGLQLGKVKGGVGFTMPADALYVVLSR